eukprot:COSAG02_NODE_10345_length_1963_cov_1.461910_1_plen_169_part_00
MPYQWDAGMATFQHTPVGRGFSSWLGYFGHCNDYWTEIDKCGMQTCSINGNPEQQIDMVDMWEQDGNITNPLGHPASTLNNSQTCSQDRQFGCHFEDDVFHAQVVKVVANAAKTPSVPLFLYWAAHACHGPREVPQPTYERFSFIPDPQRRMCDCAMCLALYRSTRLC